MKQIYCWDDLRPFGIDALTGESCGYAMRLLCDVTARGKELIESFLGSTVTIRPGSNWNGGSKEDPHVGSVLLSRSILVDLGAFALLQTTRGTAIVARDGGVCEMSAEYLERYRRLDAERPEGSGFAPLVGRVYRRPAETAVNRNEHQMSGRVS